MISSAQTKRKGKKETRHHELKPVETDPQRLQILELSETDCKISVLFFLFFSPPHNIFYF